MMSAGIQRGGLTWTQNVKGASTTHLLSADPVLIHARACWQRADWPGLVALLKRSRSLVRSTPELALYCCAASTQIGDQPAAVDCFKYACAAGVERRFALSVLLRSASTTAAQLRCLLRQVDKVDNGSVEAWLDFANKKALGSRSVSTLLRARSSRLLHYPQSDPGFSLAPPAISRSQWKAVDAATTQRYPEMASRYIYTESLGFWHPEDCRDFDYSDGDEVEERLKNILADVSDLRLDSSELIAAQTDWPSRYHFSSERANLLRPFAEELRGSRVLELGCGCGAITRYLGELGADVVAVEGSLRRAEMTAMRCHDLPAVNVVCDRAQNLPFEGRFDFVTLIGVLEYSRLYVDAPDPILAIVESARRYLAPKGRLIVAIENQLGLKYLAGAEEDHGLGVFSGVNDLYDDASVVTFGRGELERYFIRAGFRSVETHLPFPDYKLPMLIVHPSGHAERSPEWQLGSLIANTVYHDFQKPTYPTFSLERSWSVVARNGLAAELANSHLYVCSVIDCQQGFAEEKLATHFSPRRAQKYFQKVEFLKNERQQLIVQRKRHSGDEAVGAHAQALPETEPYFVGALHIDALHAVIQRPNWTLKEVIDWAAVWIDALRRYVIEPCAKAQQVGWRKYKEWLPAYFLDAAPRNFIVDESGVPQFIDLEWAAEHSIPVELVVYRGLMVSFSMITSVAEPEADYLSRPDELVLNVMRAFGWVLQEEDYARFLPIIDRVLRRAAGQGPSAELARKPYTTEPWYVRRTCRLISVDAEATVYWRIGMTSFDEEHACKRRWSLNGRVQDLSFPIPSLGDKIAAVRFDPVEKIGYVIIRRLQIESELGGLMWDWDFSNESPRSFSGCKMAPGPAKGELILTSTGNDPQFELPLPLDLLGEETRKMVLRVQMLGFSTE